MAISPLHTTGHGNRSRDGGRLLGEGPRARKLPTPGRIARRRFLVTWMKRLLPVVAVALLGSVALWPELNRGVESRISYRRLGITNQGAGLMIDPHYRGLDARNRPYMVTADQAQQDGPQRVDLTVPKGDVTLANGTWLMVQSKQGVFMQHVNQLDLSGDVVLYRADGTTLTTQTASIDLKQGAGESNDPTHAEGPFGTLDARDGFTLVDSGAVVQFHGPSRLVLNEARH